MVAQVVHVWETAEYKAGKAEGQADHNVGTWARFESRFGEPKLATVPYETTEEHTARRAYALGYCAGYGNI